jgi:4-amino-4-deoxy-L-arabinose transferase-like glycosyltransferase
MVYALGANLDIMEVDAAQYASISLEMLKSGEYLEVFDRHEDYLDKPPLLFWLSALSMKLFGIGSWQYKLPSILFSLIGIFATFKLGERLYNAAIGHHAAMIFGGSFAMIMINNDIKTDTILVASIVFSVWMLVSFIQTKNTSFLIGSAFGIAAAMLTKGPIGLVMPALAIAGHTILKKDWNALFNPKWLVLFSIVAVLLLPMCIGLYHQYGVNGLKFYFWTQSFGRITGESSWQNDTTPLYFTHVFLWSFLPWSLLGIAGLISEFRLMRGKLSEANSEFYLISGVTLVWIALSLSRFKLPHYIFVVYPLIAILVAKYVHRLNGYSRWAWTQLIVSGLACLVLAFILVYCFPAGGWIVPAVILLSVVGAVILFFNLYRSSHVILPSFILSIAIGIGMNLHFYPRLLPYQANAFVGKWVVENEIPEGRFIGFSTGGRALDFYAQRIVPWMQDAESTIEAIEPGTVVYANEDRYKDLLKYGAVPNREVVLENFEVQNLKIEFLNPKTRTEAVRKNYLLFY